MYGFLQYRLVGLVDHISFVQNCGLAMNLRHVNVAIHIPLHHLQKLDHGFLLELLLLVRQIHIQWQ